ncbi:dihydropteroate synthase [Flavobacterium succinicans]|jgi:dihydropteroate synthase|uniref:Dihydropteroate synthase n=1 Tax=Flavobacterium succinicans TaxID=29536 RepID=A0A1I4YPA2_9FLAO|nr:dihydropteroate synthase [Flavobacterium succinicans]SFN39841.1 dihydropteroate synthase [Flavobacterium succinicans]
MTINCNGQLIDLSSPKVMGILNVTPDSFFDGGRFISEKLVLQRVEKMLEEGATFIDVGGYSSKPDATFVTSQEEKARVLPIITAIVQHFPEAIVSIDTFRSDVAQLCLDQGAALVNDIAAGMLDPLMLKIVANYKVPYIMMHMKGTPQNMTTLTTYEDVTKEVLHYFSERVAVARSLGISDIIVDPGFGFAKTIDHNYELLRHLDYFSMLDLPILAGVSRKSMIYKTLGVSPDEALNGTTVLHTIALQKGAAILRVHDVKEAVEVIKLCQKITIK